MRPRLVWLALCAVIAGGQASFALAADDGGMDSIWLDAPRPAPASELPGPGATPIKPEPSPKEKEKPKPAALPSPEPEPDPALNSHTDQKSQDADAGKGSPPSTVAPMVTLDTFKGSQLVMRGGWPGVGPFKDANSPLEMTDPNGNRLKVDVNGTQVTRAELALQKQNGDFLDVQMNADFLLESVGVKPKKIVEFNEQLEKNRALVTKGDGMPNMTVGRYFIAIQRPNDGPCAYNISVNSLDADKSALKEHSVPAQTPAKTGLAGLFGISKTPPAQSTTTPPIKSQPPKKATAANPATTPAGAQQGDAMKESFSTLIKNWQNLKKTAVKTKQTGELAQLLAGRALARQSDAIKWLVTNKKFYDISPKSVVVEKYTALVPDKKYSVQTVVREQSKLCEDTGTVVSDKEDTYKVNYTIEKIGDRWFIVDSALTTSAPKAQSGGKQAR